MQKPRLRVGMHFAIELSNVPLTLEIAGRDQRVCAAYAVRCADKMEMRLTRYVEEGE